MKGEVLSIETAKRLEALEKENKRLKNINKAISMERNVFKSRNKRAMVKLDNFIDDCKCEIKESGSDYLHEEYWTMFQSFNYKVKKILNGGGDNE